MPTEKLDYIATTSSADRNKIMPRIRCKDGASLSVQASLDHFSYPFRSNGPWDFLEVAFLSGASVPPDWHCVQERSYEVFERHAHEGIDTSRMASAAVYSVEIEKLRAFIEAHGGELKEGKKPVSRDVHAQIADLHRKIEETYIALSLAQSKIGRIWAIEIGELFARVPDTIDRGGAERILFEEYARCFETALKETCRLWEQWRALIQQHDALEKQESDMLRREVAALSQ